MRNENDLPELTGYTFLSDVEIMLNDVIGYPRGSIALKSICEKYAGTMVYIPMATEFYIAWRNKQIINEFLGDNYEELALKWGLTKRQLRNIIQKKTCRKQ
jgi:Mor family transcriptional regulator